MIPGAAVPCEGEPLIRVDDRTANNAGYIDIGEGNLLWWRDLGRIQDANATPLSARVRHVSSNSHDARTARKNLKTLLVRQTPR